MNNLTVRWRLGYGNTFIIDFYTNIPVKFTTSCKTAIARPHI